MIIFHCGNIQLNVTNPLKEKILLIPIHFILICTIHKKCFFIRRCSYVHKGLFIKKIFPSRSWNSKIKLN